MRTKNELYQEAIRTVAARRQVARARAALCLPQMSGHRQREWPHL